MSLIEQSMARDWQPGDLSGLTFGQLRVFETLFEERSVRGAARRLGLTPSAVSHSLANLRYLIGDELFIRREDGMQPTARANAMAPRLRNALDAVRKALYPSEFDPATSTRQFRIACLPFMATVVSSGLARTLAAQAPLITVGVTHFGEALMTDMDDGRLDLAIAPVTRLPPWVGNEFLFDEPMVFVVRRGLPRPQGPLTLAELASMQHVEIEIGGIDPSRSSILRSTRGLEWTVRAIDQSAFERRLAEAGLARHVALRVPDTFTAALAAANSDMVALCARHAVEKFAGFLPVELLDPPFSPPTTPIRMIWNRQLDQDAGQVWLRQTILGIVRQNLAG